MAEALCIVMGAKTVMLAAAAFTLSWTHSVEKTGWQEDWRLGASGLELVEARIKGSGAGMEPPADAVLTNGWWTYRPDVPPQPSINLAASGATSGGWTLCAAGRCMELGAAPGEGIVIAPCQ